jgi:sulfane dehydrogenase subunit SoxC
MVTSNTPFVRRRRVLTLAAGAAAMPVEASRAEEAAGAGPPKPPTWTRQPGSGVLSPPYGLPSPHESGVVRKQRRAQAAGAAGMPANRSWTPLQDLHGIITPNGLHYERHHAGVPDIDPDAHRLLVHGLVEWPLVFTMDDILRFPSVSRLYFLECSGNTPFWKAERINPTWTVQDTHGLLSCCEWTGVRLADVLGEVGLRPEARWLLAEGADGVAMTRSVPIEKALDDAILAYAQNGERLRPEQGYPLRLFLPGFEGSMSVKWLRRLKVGDRPFQTREETARYTSLLPDGTARQFVFVMQTKSVITRPSGGQSLEEPGFREISGLAWSGAGRVHKVEVSTDGGKSWVEAGLQEPVLPKCLTRFRLPWRWDGGPALLQSRATDETGYVQRTRETLVAAYGTNFSYHYNGILTWRVEAGGKVALAA